MNRQVTSKTKFDLAPLNDRYRWPGWIGCSRVPRLLACLIVASLQGVCLFSSNGLYAQDAATSSRPQVLVFILAGQSNMEGKAPNQLLDHQASDPKTKALFAHLREGDQWKIRDDVWIKYLNRHGGLTRGYGSKNRTGVELQFGTVLGDRFQQPVLLVKTCWGGHSLIRDFRPPSSGLPAEDVLNREWEQAKTATRKRNQSRNRQDALPQLEDIKSRYGGSYRKMMKEVQEVQQNYESLFPTLKGADLKLAGFIWFQGWNDQYGGAELEYQTHLQHLIQDVRKDLGVPRLPFVIGLMGQNGSTPAKGAMKTIQDAQWSMMDVESFKGNVRSVRTDELVDKAAEALYPEWKERFEEWQLTGGDHRYHYLGSAIWFHRIGDSMAKAMIELLESQSTTRNE